MDCSPTGAAHGPSHRAALVASQEAAVAATEMAAESRVREEKKQKTVVEPVEVARAAIEATEGALTVTLEEGEVLFVPKHWWHDVLTLSPLALSVNHWVSILV